MRHLADLVGGLVRKTTWRRCGKSPRGHLAICQARGGQKERVASDYVTGIAVPVDGGYSSSL